MNASLPWSRVEDAVRGIFARRYFANNGPLVRELDGALARALRVEHAICVANADWALTLLAMAVARQGDVLVRGNADPSTFAAVRWAGLAPVVEPGPSVVAVVEVIDNPQHTVVPADKPILVDARGVTPFRVAAHAAVFSLQSLNAGEGGFIITDDADLAARLRTMRNFHPSETFAAVDLRTNAKMSEMQAALGLIALEQWQAAR
jgi:dTDP-4-amino-4,6-dideoxyglucose